MIASGSLFSFVARHMRFGKVALTLAIASLSGLGAAGAFAQGVPKGKPVAGVVEHAGKLADGTPYLLRKPSNWNGIVVSDLDGATRKDDASYSLLLKAGYGTAGVTRRSPDRQWTLNRWEDMQRPQQAVELFRAKFGDPKLVIAFGRSAGGASALLTAERHPDRVNGAVAMCSTFDNVGYSGYNIIFDVFYLLKVLLAPNDNLLLTHSLNTHDRQSTMDRWTEVLQAAAKTPEGRAKIALAFTLTLYPVFGSHAVEKGVAKPAPNDPNAFMDAVVQNIPHLVKRLGLLDVSTPADFPPDLEIPGISFASPVGNDGAVYADYWRNADPEYKRATEAIYAQARLDLTDDLRTIDASPRVSLNRDIVRSNVLARGLITMPVLRMDNLGDQTGSPHASKLYDQLVAFNGLSHLYRTTYVDNSGHCFLKPEQEFTAVEVMRERLQTGKWPSTTPAALNARAKVNDGDGIVYTDLAVGPEIGIWRLKAYTDLFQPATFGKVSALLNGYRYSVTDAQRAQLLSHLASAEQAASKGQTAQANAALDQFVTAANGVANRIVRTRLTAAAYQLRSFL